MSTPVDVVRKMHLFIAVKRAKEHGGSIEFPEDEE